MEKHNNISEERIPRISIGIPTYNRSDLLKGTLISVLRQTVRPYEVIVVDNCSEDDTPQVAKSFSNVLYYRNERNLGMIENWNRCIDLSSGDFLSILHSDDLISPSWNEEWIKIIARYGQDKNIGVFFSGTFTINSKGRPLIVYLIFNRDTILRPGEPLRVLWDNNMCALPTSGSIIFRKSIFSEIGKFNAAYSTEADTVVALKILNRYGIYYTPQLLFAYRVHTYQSFDKQKRLKTMDKRYEVLVNHLDIFKEFYDKELSGENKKPVFYKRIALMYIAISVFYFCIFNWKRGFKYFKLTKKVFPDLLNKTGDVFLLISIIIHYIRKIISGRALAYFKYNSLKGWAD